MILFIIVKRRKRCLIACETPLGRKKGKGAEKAAAAEVGNRTQAKGRRRECEEVRGGASEKGGRKEKAKSGVIEEIARKGTGETQVQGGNESQS